MWQKLVARNRRGEDVLAGERRREPPGEVSLEEVERSAGRADHNVRAEAHLTDLRFQCSNDTAPE